MKVYWDKKVILLQMIMRTVQG